MGLVVEHREEACHPCDVRGQRVHTQELVTQLCNQCVKFGDSIPRGGVQSLAPVWVLLTTFCWVSLPFVKSRSMLLRPPCHTSTCGLYMEDVSKILYTLFFGGLRS